ncbi:MAG: heme-copper oxidase subunit III [Anaerolineales bacterium]|nr:heme-copper oxidase subunit III [Anaerolineales bacterium]
MTTETVTLTDYQRKTNTNRLGLWLFIASDLFMFGGLFISRFYLLGTGVRPELNQFLGLAITAILLVSSFFANRGETAMAYGDRKTFERSFLITIALGIVFLVGVVGVEWQTAPYGPGESVVWSLFYTMTGFHAFHVLTGVIFLFIVFRNARKGLYNEERHWPVEAAAVYWHFIDVVWIFFYPALYLIGLPPA